MRAIPAMLLLAIVPLGGCESPRTACPLQCSPCPPLASVLVTDLRTGQPVAAVTVTGGTGTWTCSEVQGATACVSMQLTGTGAFDVAVSAPGYATATAHVAIVEQPSGDCCPACGVYAPTPVALTPL